MTVPEHVSQVRQEVEAGMDGPAADLLERVAEKLGAKASVSAVFGEPIERQGVTVIPMAKVSYGFGGDGAGARRTPRPDRTVVAEVGPRLPWAISRSKTAWWCTSRSAIPWSMS